jgi:hypothetical protein
MTARIGWVAALLVNVGGCSMFYPPRPQIGTEEMRRTAFVVTQYCLPVSEPHTVWLSIGEVRRWGYAAYQRSYGSGSVGVSARTVSGQPVFESLTYQRPIDLLATSVRLHDLEYVYLPPAHISGESWSRWLAPSSMVSADANVRWRILYEKDYERLPVPGQAPKIRYRLRAFIDGNPKPEAVPSCN